MAIDTPSDIDETRSVPESLRGLEIHLLPFTGVDQCNELWGRWPCTRNRAAVNHVAVECWKALRSVKRPPNPAVEDLHLFPQMHVDILFEVLGYLHPIELMQVSRANKAFRGLLHAPVAAALWRAAFIAHPPLPTDEHPRLPPCPPELPARRWAKLLFGLRQCDICGALDTLPDYRIWRHLCTKCMDQNLLDGIPKYAHSHEVNALVAKTFRLDGSSGDADSDMGRVWPADADAVTEAYEELKATEANTRLDDGSAPGPLAAFIEARKSTVQATEDRADETERWAANLLAETYPLAEARLSRVIKGVRKRLVLEGHDARDADGVHGLWECPALKHMARLTSRRWNKARPHVLPLVDAARAARLVRERAVLVTARAAAVHAAASHVLRTAPPQTWAYTPPAYTLETFAPLRALIQDPSDAPLADDDARLAATLVGLSAFVEAWRAEKRALLAALLPGATDPPDPRVLELATSVFTCLGSWVGGTSVAAGRCLIGWVGAGAHLRCRSLQRFWERRPHFAPEGAVAARLLVGLVGLDPAAATAAEMDAVCAGKRFLCARCDVQSYKGGRGRRALRWRECVQHTIERTRMRDGDAGHAAPEWVLLTDAGAEDVRRREAPDPGVLDSAWVCAVCTAHYERKVTRPAVIEHVRDTHKIRTPLEGTHFISFAGAERTPRVPALLSTEGHVAEFRCNRCPRRKLWALRTIKSHVLDKHGVSVPSDADWTRVERILRSSRPTADG